MEWKEHGQQLRDFCGTYELIDVAWIRGRKYLMYRNEQHPEALHLVYNVEGCLMCRTDYDDIKTCLRRRAVLGNVKGEGHEGGRGDASGGEPDPPGGAE